MNPIFEKLVKEFLDQHHGILDSGHMQTVVKFAQFMEARAKVLLEQELQQFKYRHNDGKEQMFEGTQQEWENLMNKLGGSFERV